MKKFKLQSTEEHPTQGTGTCCWLDLHGQLFHYLYAVEEINQTIYQQYSSYKASTAEENLNWTRNSKVQNQ